MYKQFCKYKNKIPVIKVINNIKIANFFICKKNINIPLAKKNYTIDFK